MEGGGGGRYFSGAPQDGFTCAVCHRPAGKVAITLDGLPSAPVPGQPYQLTLRFGEEGDPYSYAFSGEIHYADGRSAGVVTPDLSAGVSVYEGPQASGRKVFFIRKQPTKRVVTLTWTPDLRISRRVWLSIAGVGADGSSDPTGDLVGAALIPLVTKAYPD